jgi:hypothetical protein
VVKVLGVRVNFSPNCSFSVCVVHALRLMNFRIVFQ